VPGRERDLVATLRRRARLEGDPTDRREALRQAKELAEGAVGDRTLATAVLRQVLEENEGDLWALGELAKLREADGDMAEVVGLLLRRGEHVMDGVEALRLRRRAADILVTKLGDATRAIEVYRHILEQEPGDPEAAAALRKLYEREGRDRDLAELLVRLIEVADKPEARSALRMALAQLQRTKFDAPRDAAETLRAILEEEPSHADAVVALSQLLEQTGQDEDLADLLDRQVAAARDRHDLATELTLQVRLGEVYEGRLHDASRALATYEGVLERDPNHARALAAVARLSELRGNWERAAEALGKLLQQTPDRAGLDIAIRLAGAKEELGDANGVEAALKEALTRDARNEEVRARLRGIYERREKWAELADLLVGDAEIVEVPASPQLAPPIGVTAPPPTGATAEAIKLLRRAADIHLEKRGAAQDAIAVLERAAGLAPFDRELLLALCDVYTAAKREREATQVLERVIASCGPKRTKETALYHHRLGKAFAQLGETQLALSNFETAHRIDPSSVSVLRDLGMLAFETDDLDRAQKMFRALLLQRLDATAGISKGQVFYYLGEVYAKQGDVSKAVQNLERAVESEPANDRARSRLAELKS
jgi:tetratricopeptide (TPR) repeat protein